MLLHRWRSSEQAGEQAGEQTTTSCCANDDNLVQPLSSETNPRVRRTNARGALIDSFEYLSDTNSLCVATSSTAVPFSSLPVLGPDPSLGRLDTHRPRRPKKQRNATHGGRSTRADSQSGECMSGASPEQPERARREERRGTTGRNGVCSGSSRLHGGGLPEHPRIVPAPVLRQRARAGHLSSASRTPSAINSCATPSPLRLALPLLLHPSSFVPPPKVTHLPPAPTTARTTRELHRYRRESSSLPLSSPLCVCVSLSRPEAFCAAAPSLGSNSSSCVGVYLCVSLSVRSRLFRMRKPKTYVFVMEEYVARAWHATHICARAHTHADRERLAHCRPNKRGQPPKEKTPVRELRAHLRGRLRAALQLPSNCKQASLARSTRSRDLAHPRTELSLTHFRLCVLSRCVLDGAVLESV